jgi:hypothetical protein
LRFLVQRLEDLQKIEHAELNRLGSSYNSVEESIKKTIGFLASEIEETKRYIRQLMNDDPELKNKKDLLKTIPSVGEATIAQISRLRHEAVAVSCLITRLLVLPSITQGSE